MKRILTTMFALVVLAASAVPTWATEAPESHYYPVEVNTGTALSGAVITVTHIARGKTYTATTNFSGCAIFTQLQPRAYRVQETTAPVGWKLDSTAHTAAVVAGETTTVPLINQELPGLRIIKYDRKNMVAMPDVTFEVFRDAVSLGKFRTDEHGEIDLSKLPAPAYVVTEKSCPGYVIDQAQSL